MKTRTIQYGKPKEVKIVEAQVGDPEPGQVQVRGLACGICAWDIATYKTGSDPVFPTPPGHEGVGIVAKVGNGVTGLKEGQRVAGGGFGGFVNMPAAKVYPLPPSDAPTEHWIVEPVACVVNGMDHSQIRAGDRVALVGCGYMGLMFLQAVAHSPVDAAIAIDVDPKKLELAQQLGATRLINSADRGFEAAAAELETMNIDVVIDSTGVEKGLAVATRIVRRGGRINLFGWNRGTIALDANACHVKGVTIVNATPAANTRDPFPAAIRLMHRGIVKTQPLISHVISLDEYPAFLARIAASKEGYMKGVVRIAEN